MANKQYNNDIYDYVIGDYNDDGQVTVEDAQDCLEISSNLTSYHYPPFLLADGTTYEANSQQIFCCDVNGDGDIGSNDAQNVLMYYTFNVLGDLNKNFDDIVKPPVITPINQIFYGYYDITTNKFYYTYKETYDPDAEENPDIALKDYNQNYYIDLTPGQNNQIYYCNVIIHPDTTKTVEFIKTIQCIPVDKLFLGYAKVSGNTALFYSEKTDDTPPVYSDPITGQAWKYYLDRSNLGLFIFVVPPNQSGFFSRVN